MNITKFCLFVILAAVLTGCSHVRSGTTMTATQRYAPPVETGRIQIKDVEEASGLAASKCQPNVLWTHNDSGDDAFLYAIDEKGADLGTFSVPSAANVDWEDIAEYKDAAGKCWIFIAETGDNREKRDALAVYRIAEPQVSAADAGTGKKTARAAAPAEVLHFTYPSGSPDAETLMVHPSTGDIYLVTKRSTGAASVYRLKPVFGGPETATAEKIADLTVPAIPNGFVTGGDISPDGRRMTICDYVGAYEWTLPEGEKDFDKIWSTQPETLDVGKRRGGEAICYSADGGSLFTTTEGKNAPIFRIDRRP